MALETNYPKSKAPKEPQAKDELPKPHDTLPEGPKGPYGTTEGVKESEEQFEQVLVPKKDASNVTDEDEGGKGKKK